MEQQEIQDIYHEFNELVNMSSSTLERWLSTEQSKSVGWDSGDGESIGHKSGEKIVRILRKKKADLTVGDYKHMQKANGYIQRHSAQRPEGDARETNWNYSLKNWGHDYEQ